MDRRLFILHWFLRSPRTVLLNELKVVFMQFLFFRHGGTISRQAGHNKWKNGLLGKQLEQRAFFLLRMKLSLCGGNAVC